MKRKRQQNHKPNAKTLKAIEEALEGKGLSKIDNLEDFFKKIELRETESDSENSTR